MFLSSDKILFKKHFECGRIRYNSHENQNLLNKRIDLNHFIELFFNYNEDMPKKYFIT
jgi:hypothetical protein